MRALSLLAAILAVIASMAASAASAEARSYYVLKCHTAYFPADEVSQAGRHPSYRDINDCSPKVADHKLGIVNEGAAHTNAYSQYMFVAPPNTKLGGVCLQYKLRRDHNHRAEITAYPGFPVLAAGSSDPSTWSATKCFTLNHDQFIVRMYCGKAGGCSAGNQAHAFVRNIELEIVDNSPPVITEISGGLMSGSGWLRGPQLLTARAADAGGGVIHSVAYVNGVEVARSNGRCELTGPPWPRTVKLAPCAAQGSAVLRTLNTDQTPFRNGSNVLAVYVADFAGNPTTISRFVRVDNAPPQAAFSNSQDPEDPELIRAAVDDAHSGVRSGLLYYRPIDGVTWQPLSTRLEGGEALARVDSSAVPPGDYEFRAEVVDVAGNETTTLLRHNGTPMRLSFPLRTAAELHVGIGKGRTAVETVPYGTSSTVRGRLLDASGEPIADREVTVVEHFGDGALIRERPTTVVTDKNGVFRTRIPAGPSRTVEVEFAGTPKYLPAVERAGEFKVRGRVGFRTSRKVVKEGERVLFKGRVRHFGARIPPGGKLAELQVRVGAGRWDTVKEAFRTSSSGRFRLGYRFGRHYVSDALFRFRVKVQKETGWPFERTTSRKRRIIVRAN